MPASLGHSDMLVISDCGLPIPTGIEYLDLAVVQGLPRFDPVVGAIAKEPIVQKICIAEAMPTNNAEAFRFLQKQFKNGVKALQVVAQIPLSDH